MNLRNAGSRHEIRGRLLEGARRIMLTTEGREDRAKMSDVWYSSVHAFAYKCIAVRCRSDPRGRLHPPRGLEGRPQVTSSGLDYGSVSRGILKHPAARALQPLGLLSSRAKSRP